MSPGEGEVDDEQATPLPAPLPGREFKRLNRRQSIVVWTFGSIVGIAVAGGAIVILASR